MELQEIVQQGQFTFKQLVNIKGQTFRRLKPALDAMSNQEITELIQQNPSIMVRPLITNGQKVMIGFKQEEYKAFFDNT